MPSIHFRRDVLCLCGVTFGLGAAGCLGDSPSESGSRETTVSNGTTPAESTTLTRSTTTQARTTTSERPTTSERTTVSASVVSDEEAKERALTAEEAFLTDRLEGASCLENWGTYGTTMDERATVTKRTADGVYVEVRHPYSYSTDRTEADVASNAVYVVTADSIERVQGDRVSPC